MSQNGDAIWLMLATLVAAGVSEVNGSRGWKVLVAVAVCIICVLAEALAEGAMWQDWIRAGAGAELWLRLW